MKKAELILAQKTIQAHQTRIESQVRRCSVVFGEISWIVIIVTSFHLLLCLQQIKEHLKQRRPNTSAPTSNFSSGALNSLSSSRNASLGDFAAQLSPKSVASSQGSRSAANLQTTQPSSGRMTPTLAAATNIISTHAQTGSRTQQDFNASLAADSCLLDVIAKF